MIARARISTRPPQKSKQEPAAPKRRAALLSNLSYDRGEVVHWDPETMKLA